MLTIFLHLRMQPFFSCRTRVPNFSEISKKNWLSNLSTDRQTDQATNPPDQTTDKTSYIDAKTHLKMPLQHYDMLKKYVDKNRKNRFLLPPLFDGRGDSPLKLLLGEGSGEPPKGTN